MTLLGESPVELGGFGSRSKKRRWVNGGSSVLRAMRADPSIGLWVSRSTFSGSPPKT